MRVSFRCDCGETRWEETAAVDEFDRTTECETCGSSFITTVTRIEWASEPLDRNL